MAHPGQLEEHDQEPHFLPVSESSAPHLQVVKQLRLVHLKFLRKLEVAFALGQTRTTAAASDSFLRDLGMLQLEAFDASKSVEKESGVVVGHCCTLLQSFCRLLVELFDSRVLFHDFHHFYHSLALIVNVANVICPRHHPEDLGVFIVLV